MRRWFVLGVLTCLVLSLLAAACGDDAVTSSSTGGSTTVTATTGVVTSGGMTTTGAATTEATTTTAGTVTTGAAVFDLSLAVLNDGDPWPEAVTGVVPRVLEISQLSNAAQWEEFGFEEGRFDEFRFRPANEEWGRRLETEAYRFSDQAGAQAALAFLEAGFNDPTNLGLAGLLESDSLEAVEPLAIPDLGDERIGLIGTGSGFQVLFAIWRTENIVQLAYASPLLEDQMHATAFLNLITVLAERVRAG